MRSLCNRLYSDYFMPGRWGEYRRLLTTALDRGYQFVRIRDHDQVKGDRLLFLRHDIDSDLPIARKMFNIEKDLGIYSTYYFRKITADPAFIREVSLYGSEVGYHYEEISDHIKRFRLKTLSQVNGAMLAIQKNFLDNLKHFEDLLGAKVVTVASHGDFANRALGVANHYLLDCQTRESGGVKLEAYDTVLEGVMDFRGADAFYPEFWRPDSPYAAVARGDRRVLVLVHPRQWERAPLRRFCLDLGRVVDGLKFSMRKYI